MINLEELAKHNTVDGGHDWGYQIRMVNVEDKDDPKGGYCAKLMVLTNSKSTSLHYHRNKKETFKVLSGRVMIGYRIPSDSYEPEDDPHTIAITSEYGPGSEITMDRKQAHVMWAKKEYPAVILEVSTYDDDEDTYRI